MLINGFTYGFDGRKGDYQTAEAAASIERLAALGGDWAALAFVIRQDHFYSTSIRPDYRYTVTDKDVTTAVNRLHAQGLKVSFNRNPIMSIITDSFSLFSAASQYLGK